MKSNKLKINNRGGVNMKTLTKMFLLSCWCLISVSFAKETIDEIKANQDQQLIQQKLEALESQETTQVKKQQQVKEEINNEAGARIKETLEPISIENANKRTIENIAKDAEFAKAKKEAVTKLQIEKAVKNAEYSIDKEAAAKLEAEKAVKNSAYLKAKKEAATKLEAEKAVKANEVTGNKKKAAYKFQLENA